MKSSLGLVLFFASLSVGASDFVRVAGGRFEAGGRPYAFIGANLWYGMSLGSPGAGGDRARLVRELDRLKALGVTNLRVLGLSQGPDSEPWRIAPSLETGPGVYSGDQLSGLDFLLHEMGLRGMRAVICLNNFWPWSGGMAQYLRWAGAAPIPYPPPEPGGDWGTYQRYTAAFYSDARAVELAERAVGAVVSRVNRISGRAYAEDPAIMAWELANEPRGGANVEAFNRWISRSAAFIKALDPRHLVTTGSEGETPWPEGTGLDLVVNHSDPNIDYVTAHVWAQNWGWFDPADPGRTFDLSVARMREYIRSHAEKSRSIGKPLVVEEFGLARDGGSFDPAAPTRDRDRYYRAVFEEVTRLASEGVSGANFWAWAGEGRPVAPGGHWTPGHPFTGDPPHEGQGWYGVYAEDLSTQAIISEFAGRMGTR